jgi:hypothetical protein
MTEQQKYDVVRRIPDSNVEIRRYHECVMADVVVNAEYQNAGNMGFRPLVTYISRNNIAMTAPVVQEQRSAQSWIVSFVMPAGMKLSDLPLPANSNVTLRTIPAHEAATLSFSGVTSENKVELKERELRQVLAREGLQPQGQLRIARFDPPWKPGFMRHNEVVLPL